jgi:hypothetical protein
MGFLQRVEFSFYGIADRATIRKFEYITSTKRRLRFVASVRRSRSSENSSYRHWTQARRTELPKEAKAMPTKKRSNDHAQSSVQKRSRPISHEPRDEVTKRGHLSAASVAATEYANEVDESDLPTGDWSQ